MQGMSKGGCQKRYTMSTLWSEAAHASCHWMSLVVYHYWIRNRYHGYSGRILLLMESNEQVEDRSN